MLCWLMKRLSDMQGFIVGEKTTERSQEVEEEEKEVQAA